jgi:DnaJ-class molecular chaperone
MCSTCQGTGEIVTDWDRYLKPHKGDAGDEAVIICPDCDGTGEAAFDTLPTPPSAQNSGELGEGK